MIRRSIRLTFGAKAQPGITLQRGDCFSTAICAQCYAPNGCPVSFEGRTVHVVYQTGGQSSPGYEVEARDNVLTWTLPPCAAQTAGPGKMQLMVYGADSLLHSAVIPYTVLDSLEPGEGGEDPVPALVLLLDKAQAAISGANAAASTANQVAQIADTAANLASEKAGLAQNAASSANEAATNATNSAELAQTAADNANSASESANSAAGTANNAADNANQVADEIQQKADSGAFNGKDGLNAPQIDDTQITTTNPWSSMQIVKTLCPPFTVSGSVVQCYPVANYPLGVKVAWEPHQEGEGDPSPENVRPITGMDEVRVTRAGKNLIPITANEPLTTNGVTWTVSDGVIHAQGTASRTSRYVVARNIFLPQGTYAVNPAENIYYELISGDLVVKQTQSHFTLESDFVGNLNLFVLNGNTADVDIYPSIELGSTPTAYEPYRGDTFTIDLGQTVYGGTLDVVSGKIETDYAELEFDGSDDERWKKNTHSSGRVYYIIETSKYVVNANDPSRWLCSRLKPHQFNYADTTYPTFSIGFQSNRFSVCIVLENDSSLSVEEFRAWLSENPVQFVYDTNSEHWHVDTELIPALPGTNTVHTDADTVTVSGLSDPVSTIASLQARVSALESAQTNM